MPEANIPRNAHAGPPAVPLCVASEARLPQGST